MNEFLGSTLALAIIMTIYATIVSYFEFDPIWIVIWILTTIKIKISSDD